MLLFVDRMDRMQHLKSQISDLKSQAEGCSRQLRAWADSLQNSDIRGQRHLNERTRETSDRRQRVDAFMEKLEQIRAGAGTKTEFGFSETSGDADA